MIKRIVEISRGACRLSVKLNQLVILREDKEPASVPIEDIGVLLVDNPAVTYTHSVLTELTANNCAVVLCNGRHHPACMMLPLETNTLQNELFRHQIDAKEPLKKRLWQEIIRAKIQHQAAVVKDYEQISRLLKKLAKQVKSGDSENCEAFAARKYWPVFIEGTLFKRDREGRPPNNLLNYGYMVLRAAVARSICSAGLLPTLGIHHRNRYNAYCLADDLMEPFRGYVDQKVRRICQYKDDIANLDQLTKQELISVMYEQVAIGGFKGPLMVGLHRTAASLGRCFKGTQKRLELPEYG
jgi:CRISP-associated protein Cas1